MVANAITANSVSFVVSLKGTQYMLHTHLIYLLQSIFIDLWVCKFYLANYMSVKILVFSITYSQTLVNAILDPFNFLMSLT